MLHYLVLAACAFVQLPSDLMKGRRSILNDYKICPVTTQVLAHNGTTRGGSGSRNASETLKEAISTLYSNENLLDVIQLHRTYESQITAKTTSSEVVADVSSSYGVSLQDLIESTIRQQQPNIKKEKLPPMLLEKVRSVRAVASDVDGTLVSSSTMRIHPRTHLAIKRAIQDPNLLFFPATGRSRKGAMYALGPEVEELMTKFRVPGVYLQGLYCVDGHGNILHESKLSYEATAMAEEVAMLHGVSIVGFDGDDLYTTEVTPIVKHLSDHCGEPMPKLIFAATATASDSGKTIRLLSDHSPGLHKVMLMDEDSKKLDRIRPILERLGEQYGASVTQALSTMLEWIPAGNSKANGVLAVCSSMNIDPEKELLALGDAENDVLMLKMAAVGLAVANGCRLAKEAADYVLDYRCEDGAVGDALNAFIYEK
jgi:hydroxymethylpyrimidine pyrophosphatase-like HAD family hydrolase